MKISNLINLGKSIKVKLFIVKLRKVKFILSFYSFFFPQDFNKNNNHPSFVKRGNQLEFKKKLHKKHVFFIIMKLMKYIKTIKLRNVALLIIKNIRMQ